MWNPKKCGNKESAFRVLLAFLQDRRAWADDGVGFVFS